MQKETFKHIRDLFSFLFQKSYKPQTDKGENGFISIPIIEEIQKTDILPIHNSKSSHSATKIPDDFMNALGSVSNVESIREITGSQRIRVTLFNPALLNETIINDMKPRFYLRIGEKIIHFIL